MNSTKTYINVLSLLKREIPITDTDGETLNNEIIHTLNSGGTVMLDFTGITAIGAPFANRSLGDLLSKYDLNELLFNIEFIGTSNTVASMLWLVLENAQTYHRNKSGNFYRDIVHGVVLDFALESSGDAPIVWGTDNND